MLSLKRRPADPPQANMQQTASIGGRSRPHLQRGALRSHTPALQGYSIREPCRRAAAQVCKERLLQCCAYAHSTDLATPEAQVEPETNTEGMSAWLDGLKWDAGGLVAVIAQHVDTGEILMQAYADRAALNETLQTRLATFYSRSRKGRWCKGETSGHFIKVLNVYLDCDRDSIIYQGEPIGPACHTGAKTCYFSSVERTEGKLHEAGHHESASNMPASSLFALESIIQQRVQQHAQDTGSKPSWTAKLANNQELLCSKIREEAGELCETLEKEEGQERAASEMADMLYHSMVLLHVQDVPVERVLKELRRRFGTSGIDEKAARKPWLSSCSKACAQQKHTLPHIRTVSKASRRVTTCSVQADTQLDTSMQHQGSASLETAAPDANSHVKMQVARVVMPGHQVPLAHRMVPRPRQGKAIVAYQLPQQGAVLQNEQGAAQRQPSEVMDQRNSAHNRAIRAEMASVASELQTKKAQLGKADAALRQRDSEIAALRTSLAERDSKVQASRSELAELQLQVKSHEQSLQHAYNQLAEASRDKARVRQQLLENQAELTGVHSHLVEWSQDLHQLKSIMDTLEEEDRLMDQAYISRSHQSHGSNGKQTDSTGNGGKDLRELTANVAHHTQSALSASTQTPQDGMELLEGIANLSKQMVGEAKEDVKLFKQAGESVSGQGT